MIHRLRIPVHLFFVLVILHNFIPGSNGQNAPITTAATLGGAIPGTITIPVTVIDFNNIGAISLTLDYDYSVLHFIQGIPNSQLPGFTVNDNNLGNGYHRLIMGWYGSGRSLGDGSIIMNLSFTFISGITALAWFDNGSSCEYANGSYVVLNDIPQSTYYINGYVCGGIGNPGTITGDNSVCQGEQGVIYSVSPVTNATGYIWNVPAGATIVSGGNTNSIMVDYSTSAVSGNVSVYGINACGNGPSSQLAVTVNVLPVTNAGNDVSIPYGTYTTLSAASGGTGSFNYHWSPEALLVNPDLQTVQTVNLTSTTIFTLHVTNQATLCLDSDEVIVTITGGPLNVNPLAVPDIICYEQASQLFANAGGGSGNYSYQWTSDPPGNPPWNSSLADPEVTPDTSTQYYLSVSDGFNTISGSTYVTVNQLPTATLSGGDSLCDDGSTTAITIDFTGIPPWLFTFSDGLNSYIVYDQMTTPYQFVTSDPGTYTVLFIQDANCIGLSYGSATIWKFPVPDTPVISQNGAELVSSLCCGNQWYLNDDPVDGANNQIYIPLENGYYYDIVTIDGCSSDTSNTILVTLSGTGPKKMDQLWFYPNPAKDWIKFMNLSNGSHQFSVQFINIYGVRVKETFLDFTSIEDIKEINIEGISPGLYLLSIEEQSKTYFYKVLIE